MFTSLESFSVFFFTGLALLLLGIIFDKQLIKLEKKIDKKIADKKALKKSVRVSTVKKSSSLQAKPEAGRRSTRIAA